MTQRDSTTIEAELQALEQNASTFIGKLEQQLKTAEGERLTEETQENLRTQIQNARRSYDGILKERRTELETVRAAEAQALKAAEAQIERHAAETKSQIKREMMTNWVKAGGSLDAFDKIFEEQLYPAEMTRRTLRQGSDQGEEGQARRQQQNLIRGTF